MQYKLIIPEKQCKVNNMRTDLFPKEDFNSSLNPKRKPKVRVRRRYSILVGDTIYNV